MEKYIGKVLNDRYMITEVIGVGGMAYVFKAFDKVCNRLVAVKVLKDEFMADAQFRRRFTNESKAITMLSHSNIVDVYDVCLEGDALYIVMEYIDGITLKEYMDKKGVLSSNEALHFLKQILGGLAHAHERGIVHRDIKPHNIILLKDGTIKITDFGIARLTKFDTQTMSDMAIGSVHYISPEQASGDRTDARSDIYSVGIILYEMLTSKLPFEADTAVAVALMQVQSQPDLPTELNAEIPQGLEDITLKAIMKDPAIRYQSAAAILADIAQFEGDPTITFDYLNQSDEQEIDLDNSPTISASSLEELMKEDHKDVLDAIDADNELLDDEEEENESKFKSIWLPIIAGVGSAFVILILIAVGVIFQKELFGGKMVACPNVVGMKLDKAKKENEFKFVVGSTVASDEYEEGEIVSQEPKAGEDIKKKGTINVVVSSGAENDEGDTETKDEEEKKVVPDVANKSRSEAIDAFKENNISYRIVNQYSDDVETGYVVSTDPVAGEEVLPADIVTIYVSGGPEADPTVTMPDLSNLTLSVAKTTLTNNKLKVGNIDEEYSDTIAEGEVIFQSIAKNESVEVGTAVDLVVSLGKKPEEKTMVTMPDLSNMSLSVAQTTIINNKLTVGLVVEEYNDTIAAGNVIFQSVVKDESVEEGTVINLVVSLGAKPIEDDTTVSDGAVDGGASSDQQTSAEDTSNQTVGA